MIIGSDGISRITDFGVARAETRLSSTREGPLTGKIPYMPPEQLMAEPVDQRCDVYAAGVVLWEAIIGRRLFKAPSEGALLQKILMGPQELPSKDCPDLPNALDEICQRALSWQPQGRFATAGEFAEAIEEAGRSSGVGIATSRAVARFVEQSDVYEPLDPKKLAKLKQEPIPASLAVPDGLPSTPSGTSMPLSVTAIEATISQTPDPPPPQTRSRMALWGGIGVAALGLAAVLLLAQRDNQDSTAAAAATNAPTARPEDDVPPPAASETTAALTATASASPSAASIATASAEPSGQPATTPPLHGGSPSPKASPPKLPSKTTPISSMPMWWTTVRLSRRWPTSVWWPAAYCSPAARR